MADHIWQPKVDVREKGLNMRNWIGAATVVMALGVQLPAMAADLEGSCPGGYDLVTVESMLALGHTITEERVDRNGTFDGWYCIHELPLAAWARFGGWQPGYPETLKLFGDNETPR